MIILLGMCRDRDNLFEVWHGGAEVKIGKANAQKLCPQGTDGGIDE